MGWDRIILFYMDNLIRPGGLFYIKVDEKTAIMSCLASMPKGDN